MFGRTIVIRLGPRPRAPREDSPGVAEGKGKDQGHMNSCGFWAYRLLKLASLQSIDDSATLFTFKKSRDLME